MAISAAFPFAPHYVEVEGVRLHYVEQGTGDPRASRFAGSKIALPSCTMATCLTLEDPVEFFNWS